MSFDWKGTVGKVAPILAGILGTPAAGVAVSGLCSVLGLEPSPENAEKAATAIAAGQLNGDQLIQLKKVETDSVAALKKLGLDFDIQEATLVFTDRASARKREETVKDWTPRILAYGITLGFFGMLYWMMRHDIPGINKDMLNIMLGAFATAWIQVVSYYFGSSAGSEAKNSIIAKQANQ